MAVTTPTKQDPPVPTRRRSARTTLAASIGTMIEWYDYGLYGIVALAPQYFVELGLPTLIERPEHFYGFIGVAVAWQLVFLVMSLDPVRYRLLMLPSIVEKFSFGIAALVLFGQGRINPMVLAFSCVDMLLGVLFAIAFWQTGKADSP